MCLCVGGGGGREGGRGPTPPHPLREILLAAHSIFNLKYRELEKNSKIFYNRTNYDYHFIVKELAEEFERQFTSLNNMKCAIAKTIDAQEFEGKCFKMSFFLNNLFQLIFIFLLWQVGIMKTFLSLSFRLLPIVVDM